MQVMLAALILVEAVMNYGDKFERSITKWQASWVMVSRMICVVVMHINLMGKVTQGMNMMKYSLNHTWKFDGWHFGFIAGFL